MAHTRERRDKHPLCGRRRKTASYAATLRDRGLHILAMENVSFISATQSSTKRAPSSKRRKRPSSVPIDEITDSARVHCVSRQSSGPILQTVGARPPPRQHSRRVRARPAKSRPPAKTVPACLVNVLRGHISREACADAMRPQRGGLTTSRLPSRCSLDGDMVTSAQRCHFCAWRRDSGRDAVHPVTHRNRKQCPRRRRASIRSDSAARAAPGGSAWRGRSAVRRTRRSRAPSRAPRRSRPRSCAGAAGARSRGRVPAPCGWGRASVAQARLSLVAPARPPLRRRARAHASRLRRLRERLLHPDEEEPRTLVHEFDDHPGAEDYAARRVVVPTRASAGCAVYR